jgi:hypothetical protein
LSLICLLSLAFWKIWSFVFSGSFWVNSLLRHWEWYNDMTRSFLFLRRIVKFTTSLLKTTNGTGFRFCMRSRWEHWLMFLSYLIKSQYALWRCDNALLYCSIFRKPRHRLMHSNTKTANKEWKARGEGPCQACEAVGGSLCLQRNELNYVVLFGSST